MPVDRYPGLPRHQIEHIHVQRTHHLRSPPPPPPPLPFPVIQPNQNPTLSVPFQHQPPSLPPPVSAPQPIQPIYPQPFLQSQSSYLDRPRINYTAQLMQNFDVDQQRHNPRRPSRSSSSRSVSRQAGPIQHVINFQHEADQQSQAQEQQARLLDQQRIQYERQQEQQEQQALLQQRLAYQRQLQQEHQAQIQGEIESQGQLEQGQQQAVLQQQREHQRYLHGLQQVLQDQQTQQQNAVLQVQQLSQTFLSQALSEHSQHSVAHYEQDQQRQQQQLSQDNTDFDSPPLSPLSSLPSSNPDLNPSDSEDDNDPSPPSSPPPAPAPAPAPASTPTPAPSPSPPPPPPPPLPPSPSPPPPPPAPHIPLGGRPYREPIQIHSLGPMNIQCPHCHALHFISEKLSNSSLRNPRFGMCCLQGQVNLPPIQQWPRVLQDLFDDPQDQREFRKKIRQYNNALAFTSVGADLENNAIQGPGPASFRIHGALHHLMGALVPPDGLEPCFAQLYIFDPEEATERRVQYNPQLNGPILLDLHTMLRTLHPYAPLYKQAYEVMQVSDFFYLCLILKLIILYRLSHLRSIQMYACEYTFNKELMSEDTIYLLWRK